MDIFSRMLVAIDGSTTAQAAVEASVRLAAGRPNATIRFVTAFERARLIAEYASAMTFVGNEAFDSLRNSAYAALHAALSRTTVAKIGAEGTVREGDPVDQILAEARDWRASCIVMGTHGRTGVARALLGSITEETLRASGLPVLVVRANQPQGDGRSDRIVCALDDSAPARAAFETALAIARERGNELDLLCVIPIDADVAEAYEHDGRDAGGVAQFYAQYASRLTTFVAQAGAAGVRATAHVLGAPDVAMTIVQYAAGQEAGLIVMGTHGRVGLQRALLGSTAENVLRHSDVPVLIVRTTEHPRRRVGDRVIVSAVTGAYP